jgi:hypothetical protein
MAAVSKTKAVSLTKKKARPRKITKKGPGIFVECGKVRLGKRGDWAEIGSIGLRIFKSEPPQIGLWGIVKNGKKSFKEIAAQVYGDASKVKFILDANKVYKDMAFEGQQLFIPNLTYNRLKKQNEFVNSNYYYTHADLYKVKPIMQISGDVYVPYDLAYVNQYYFAGKDNNSRLVASETLTFREFHREMVTVANKINDNHLDTYGQATWGTGKAIKNRKELKFLKTRVEKGGKLSFRIDKKLKTIDCKPSYGRWIGYGNFAKRIFKGAFSKGTIIFSVVVAGCFS